MRLKSRGRKVPLPEPVAPPVDVRSEEQIRGVYRIVVIPMQRAYIGSSNNVMKRWRHHIEQLVRRKHVNKRLQYAFNFYGPRAFRLDVLEHVSSVEAADLTAAEQRWIEQHEQTFNVYEAGTQDKLRRPRSM